MSTFDGVPLSPESAARQVVVAELLDGPDPRRVRAMRAEAQYHRRRNITWNELEDGWHDDVPDLTAHAWPMACQSRSRAIKLPGNEISGASHQYTCTRRAFHTGRHAAGAFGRIVAVWSR